MPGSRPFIAGCSRYERLVDDEDLLKRTGCTMFAPTASSMDKTCSIMTYPFELQVTEPDKRGGAPGGMT